MADWLEDFWGDLLSEEPMRIISAWTVLDDEEKQVIHQHLTAMSNEEGWSDGQREAAKAALKTIDSAQAG